ncbi:homeobox-leucine zipper protein GLABRA 2 [Tripterygium wilfordii]|uniref:Homeobox-leucine zipper protein GLABRA 2 n=1 Tax=Tripterygium wilfordii TaxID=458696 RepID=A0A7J7BYV9_TRIWF|nr:homeobox-leucine zipper protein GLABRA 2-like [Tripterygium wilfordii]KAF5726875.1 homeobox-leucine zipper protein GLABRA 2 [Tripterygium wilfordii]
MDMVEMSNDNNHNNNPPTSRTKDFFASPALSLSLAGIFRDARANAVGPASSEGEEGSCGGGGRRDIDPTVEISSENSGPVRSRSVDEDFDNELGDHDLDDFDEDDDDGDKKKKKKRKKYHRHTSEQIREMDALFKESPHPDEKQRQQLSKQLGLAPRQIKFWFQNRRTQIKAIQERHENSLLKNEIEKLREGNKAMRETINKACCPNCGMATTSRDASITTEDQQLRIENAKLKAEVERLRKAIGKYSAGATASCSENEQENRSSLDFYTGIFGLEKSRIMEIANQALEELKKMATAGEPLWIRSLETGREILNYDEYVKEFKVEYSSNERPKRSIEASRETGFVFVDLPKLVQSFMDVNQWKEMFPCIISKAATVDLISNGEGGTKNGAVQLMFAELQMLTPTVPTREVYFVRYCKQLSSEQWAIVDVSVDKVEENIDASLSKCRKRPSGCIIEDKSNGHCKVIWVEHLECQKSPVHSLYRTVVNGGLAFGATHWIATLQLQCERLVFFMATNVPTKDSSGVATLAGRKSILKLAQRMTWSFYHAIGASSYHTWNKVTSKTGEDIRISSRKNLNDPGEPIGVILCAVSSLWLPVSPHVLFDFLRDEAHRHEWDIMSSGGPAQTIANLANGQDRGNTVTIQAMNVNENSMWILQDGCTNAYESMVVYAPVNITGMQSVITGCDSSNVAVLPSGYSILPDGIESRPQVITSRQEEKSTEGGSLLTIAFQVLTNASPMAKLTMESVESVNTLISCTLRNIKTSLKCEDS